MKRLKSFKFFESSNNSEIISTVRDMLLELDFLDINSRCDLVPYVKKVSSDIEENTEIIVVYIWKKAVRFEWSHGIRTFKPSYVWNDIKDVIEPIIEYLESEGFEWLKNAGTGVYNNDCPIITTSGSQEFDTIKSKLELWFTKS